MLPGVFGEKVSFGNMIRAACPSWKPSWVTNGSPAVVFKVSEPMPPTTAG